MDDSNFYQQPTLPSGSQTTTPTPEKIPEKIGPYKIEAFLERGSMSFLYLATHPETKDLIVIKLLFSEFSANPEMVQRFLREAEIIALADHPNIVNLYGQGKWEDTLYIAMEFVQGSSLRQYLQCNLISLKYALEIVMEIAMALCHLHAHGIIHRDLKPENILITDSGGVKVIDFGIAQLLAEQASSTSVQKRRLIGTPIYMSPEQKENPESTSYPSDVYSLGIITYELVLGKLSHGHIHLSLMPRGLQKILTKALQPKAEDRYQDMVDFMSDLSAYMNSPALLKDNKEVAPLSDLSESLRMAQQSLVPAIPPQWPHLDIGLATHKGLESSSLYYDFFKLADQTYGIIIGEPTIKGSPGIVYTSVFRGMVRALSPLTQKPDEIATVLNSLLCKDSMNQNFAFSYLVLLPQENLIRFISTGGGNLWYQPAGQATMSQLLSNNPPLGLDSQTRFNSIEQPWQPGDRLILYASSPYTSEILFSDDWFKKLLEETIHYAPQFQTDFILKKIKIYLSRPSQDRAFFLTSIARS